jgi:NAD(P)-dependent dehydrogenase (short-subunit alcohol dehydrogenase family)
VITRANSGIGYEAAQQLAARGAHVVLACRDQAKGRRAVEAITAAQPSASVALLELDLANLGSSRRFAEAVHTTCPALHVLCNNAGVMAIPHRTTADGFEMQFGTNHLGHFALTGLLLDRLLATPSPRVVTVSSNAHKWGAMHWDDLQGVRTYRRWRAYAQSKLANLLFTYELQRRLVTVDAGLISVACHPGYAATKPPGGGTADAGVIDR